MPEGSTLTTTSMAGPAAPVPATPSLAPAAAGRLPAGPADFRQLMGSFPTGVSVITATGDCGPRGMTCSSLTSVCLEPPTLAVCLHTASSTLSALADSGRFAVNLLHARGAHAAQVFASAVSDRFALVDWQSSPAGLPWLTEDAFAVAECQVVGSTVLGDHTVVFGEVSSVSHSPEPPLVYGRRSFRSWDELSLTDAESAA
jgi:flavin reductase (DIM6/NTAB) family NADH-FMN oxidoreductase RutF